MIKRQRWLFVGLLILGLTPLLAADMAIKPFVKGSFGAIKQQRHNHPFIVIFWSESCAYCMKELALFGELQKTHPKMELVVVATDPFLEEETVRAVLKRSQLKLKESWVFAEVFPEQIYRDVNRRWRGELPVTHFFGEDNREIRHLGVVKEAQLKRWLATQYGP